MSFGWSGSDVFLLTQLAWNTIQNARKACGEYDELTRETLRLHAILQRLEQEVAKPDSPVNRPGDTSKKQLEHIASDCGNILEQLDKIVAAYAALTEENRSARKMWQKVRFGNGQIAVLSALRSKIVLYTSEMLFYMNLVTMGTVGRIEQQLTKDGGILNDIKIAVEKNTAHSVLSGANVEGSMMTRYDDDDTSFWRSLRRELVKEGFPSAAIHEHKHLIKEYVKELGARGVLDHGSPEENDDQHDSDGNPDMLKEDPAPCSDPERGECIVCLSDDVPILGTALLPCKHRWCNPCLRRIFTLSTTDPQHMPPTCCKKQSINLKHVENLFDNRFKRKWNRKYQEYTTKDRIYCPARGCGAWIKPTHIHVDTSGGANGGRKYGKCQRCRTRVCCTCNKRWSTCYECPKDAATEERNETLYEELCYP